MAQEKITSSTAQPSNLSSVGAPYSKLPPPDLVPVIPVVSVYPAQIRRKPLILEQSQYETDNDQSSPSDERTSGSPDAVSTDAETVRRRSSADQVLYDSKKADNKPDGQNIQRPATVNDRNLLSRPLSDIKEITEPSLDEIATGHARRRTHEGHFSRLSKSEESGPKLPSSMLPRRNSSHRMRNRHSRDSRSSAPQSLSQLPYPPSSQPPRVIKPGDGRASIRTRGNSQSPVRASVLAQDPVSSESTRRRANRTFVRTTPPVDILDSPVFRHSRVEFELRTSSPLYQGGSAVEGHLDVTVDGGAASGRRNTTRLSVGKISVDVLGVEEVSVSKRAIFLSVASELIDNDNPPPPIMVASFAQHLPSPPYYPLAPSKATMPFSVNLPLDVGPPPFQSKHAKIKYLLSVTMVIRVGGKQNIVRRTQEISLLSVFNPEKALVSLSSPLTAYDEYVPRRGGGAETIRVTAGTHRQVWVSGTSMFVDVHIVNKSSKTVKKVHLQLEQIILQYKHAAAFTFEKSATSQRISDGSEMHVVSRSAIKQGTFGWNGVPAHTTDVRTWELPIPRGLASIRPGRYFEVRYRVNIIVSTSLAKLASVQLPLIIIPMNSLDVVPNALSQVAAAIEDKRSGREPARRSQLRAGEAFTIPLKNSLTRLRRETTTSDDVADLQRQLEESPRKHAGKARSITGDERLRRQYSRTTNGDEIEQRGDLRRAVSHEWALPRLRFDTDGLGFSDTEATDDDESRFPGIGLEAPVAGRKAEIHDGRRRLRRGSEASSFFLARGDGTVRTRSRG